MGRMYSVIFEKVAVTAAQDLFEINAPADSSVILHSVYISQDSEEGDAESELVSIIIHRGSTSGSGGTTPTAAPLSLGDSAFGGTVEVNNTTQSTEGTILHADSMNLQLPYIYMPTPETRITISPSDRLIIELQDVVADSVTMSGTAVIEEIGG